ncbi:MAG: Hpt domain-containing protein, partial [Pseudacidovorax sp.]|nr:Hpt domain-containing protein [Pseudacidovorax sp.]
PKNVGELTTLRRAFHTLKGSSRMVGLNEFGEGAWAMEQVLNTWLADQKPASDELRGLATQALGGFGRWIEDIAANNAGHWQASAFRVAADAMRVDSRLQSIELPGEAPAAPAAAPAAPAAAPAAQDAAILDTLKALESVEVVEAAPMLEPAQELQDLGFTLDLGEPAAAPAPAAAAPAPLADLGFDLEFDAEPAAEPAPDIGGAEVAELSADELPPEFAQFGTTAILPKTDLPATPAAPVQGKAPQQEAPELISTAILPRMDLDAPVAPTAPEAPIEIAGIDFSSLSAVAGPAAPAAPAARAPMPPADVPMSPLDDFSFDFPSPDVAATSTTKPAPLEVPRKPVAEPEPVEAAQARDEQVKVIGNLRIGIPLYNVYLNEADEWSRRLVQEISEWTLQMDERVPDSTVGWAHALAGSSATVGFQALSDIARALEGALQHTQTLAEGTPDHARAFTEAAEEVRRLLHQFAAGFLKQPEQRLLQELHELKIFEGQPRSELASELPPVDDLDYGLPPARPAPAPVRPAAPLRP